MHSCTPRSYPAAKEVGAPFGTFNRGKPLPVELAAATAGAGSTPPSPVNEYQLTRTLTQDYEGRVHDLHKLVFTFITALLTAQALLLPSIGQAGSSGSSLSSYVKLGVLLVTLVLVIALRALEKNYQLYLKAASNRASILERRAGYELNQTIVERNSKHHQSLWVSVLYSLLVGADALLGTFVMPSGVALYLLYIAALASVIFIVLVGEFRKLAFSHGEEDWSVDTVRCQSGQPVLITVSNFADRDDREERRIKVVNSSVLAPANSIIIANGQPIFEMVADSSRIGVVFGGDPPQHAVSADTDIVVPPGGQHSWIWVAPDSATRPAIYRLYPSMPQKGDDGMLTSGRRALWPIPIPPEIVVS